MNHYIIFTIVILVIIAGAIAAFALTKDKDKKTGQENIGIFSNTFYDNADSGDFGTAINMASQRWNNYINNDININIDYKTFNDSNSNILAYARMHDSSNIFSGGTITINIGRKRKK